MYKEILLRVWIIIDSPPYTRSGSTFFDSKTAASYLCRLSLKMAKQDGLEWVATPFSLEPHWTIEPNIAKVKLLAPKHLKLEQNASCHVTFYAEGAFSKLYKIETEAGCSLMRITPVFCIKISFDRTNLLVQASQHP